MNNISSIYATPSSERNKQHFIICFQALVKVVFLSCSRVFLFEVTKIWLTISIYHGFVSICHSYIKQPCEETYNEIDCDIKRLILSLFHCVAYCL